MTPLAPCCQPDSNVSLLVRERAFLASPAYAPSTSLRGDLHVSRRSVLIVSLAGAVSGILWAILDAVA